jgi:ATP-binding cassette subfamily F protein 3
MPLLTLSNVGKHFGAEEILEGVSFSLERGEHTALIGPNGAGKSTLLRIIIGAEEPDTGAVSRARGLKVVYLPQDPDFDSTHTLYEAMLETFSEVISAQERLRVLEGEMAREHTPEQVEEYGGLQALVEHEGYDYRERIKRVLTGLGLLEETWYSPIDTLSGGQRTRANLARTLLQDGDVLLLDEPTNHLDIQAVEWLEGYLRDLKRAFLIVAHDRYLLDHVSHRTLELSSHRVTSYDAPYTRFLELKAEHIERQRLEYEAQQRHITKTEDFIRRYGAGQRYKEARGRQKRLDRLERLEKPQEEAAVHLGLTRASRSGDIVLETRRVVAGYSDAPLVHLPEQIFVRRGEKIAVIGPNGAGKTTLLRTLLGSLPALSGEVRWGARTSIAYYSQTLGDLNDGRTVLEEIQAVRSMSEEEARSFLGSFLFSGDDVFKRIGMLSGGERSRVALARLILGEPNVLVLDEPTNHLDISSRDALQAVLSGFEGTLLFVSHDRYLIDSLADQLWVVQDGQMIRYNVSYSAYAEGSAKPLDRPDDPREKREAQAESPDVRVRRLESEAEALAGRLSQAGPTTALGQLSELTERYAEILMSLQEAQGAWIRAVREEVGAFSGSRGRSGAGRRR